MPLKGEAGREYGRRYYEENQEHYRQQHRDYYWENKDRLLAQAKVRRLKQRYGLLLDDFYSMLAAQGNRCAICLGTEHGAKEWAVDHCHRTGRIRGILCNKCNPMLGMAKDSTDILIRAAQYLGWGFAA